MKGCSVGEEEGILIIIIKDQMKAIIICTYARFFSNLVTLTAVDLSLAKGFTP